MLPEENIYGVKMFNPIEASQKFDQLGNALHGAQPGKMAVIYFKPFPEMKKIRGQNYTLQDFYHENFLLIKKIEEMCQQVSLSPGSPQNIPEGGLRAKSGNQSSTFVFVSAEEQDDKGAYIKSEDRKENTDEGNPYTNKAMMTWERRYSLNQLKEQTMFHDTIVAFLEKELVKSTINSNPYNVLKQIYLDVTQAKVNDVNQLKQFVSQLRAIVKQVPKVHESFMDTFDEQNNPRIYLERQYKNNREYNAELASGENKSTDSSLNQIKRVALIDVDGTLKIKRHIKGQSYNGINMALIEDLKKNNINDVYLFTNMELTDMDAIANPSGFNYITRRQLVDFLTKNGIKVHGVMTQADVVYKKGLGAAYRDFYEPAYDACLTNPEQYQATKRNQDSHFNQYKKIVNTLPKFDNNSNNEGQGQKKLMFEYFKEHVNNKDLEIFYYDDYKSCLNTIQTCDPSVKTFHVVDNNLPLYIPANKQEDFVNLSNTVKLENPAVQQKLSFIQLGKDSSRDSINALKKTIRDEINIIAVFYNHIPSFKAKFDELIKGMSFVEYTALVEQRLNSDIASASRKVITPIAELLSHDTDLYKKITGNINNQADSNRRNIFELFPDLSAHLLKKSYDQLKTIAMLMLVELDQKLSTLKDKANSIIQAHSQHKDYASFINAMTNMEKNAPKDSFLYDKSKEKVSYYINNILQLGNVMIACDDLLNMKKIQENFHLTNVITNSATPILTTIPTTTASTAPVFNTTTNPTKAVNISNSAISEKNSNQHDETNKIISRIRALKDFLIDLKEQNPVLLKFIKENKQANSLFESYLNEFNAHFIGKSRQSLDNAIVDLFKNKPQVEAMKSLLNNDDDLIKFFKENLKNLELCQESFDLFKIKLTAMMKLEIITNTDQHHNETISKIRKCILDDQKVIFNELDHAFMSNPSAVFIFSRIKPLCYFKLPSELKRCINANQLKLGRDFVSIYETKQVEMGKLIERKKQNDPNKSDDQFDSDIALLRKQCNVFDKLINVIESGSLVSSKIQMTDDDLSYLPKSIKEYQNILPRDLQEFLHAKKVLETMPSDHSLKNT